MLALLATLHFGIAGCAGFSCDLVGPRLELRADHLALTAAISPLLLHDRQPGESDFSMAFGARWYLGGGDRFFISGQYSFDATRNWTGPIGDPESELAREHVSIATVVAGWRWKWSGFFLEAGAGGGLLFDSDSSYRPIVVPDLTVGLGWEF